MVGDGQSFSLATGIDAAKLNVTSTLRDHFKTELAENGNDLLTGKSFKPWQGGPPVRT